MEKELEEWEYLPDNNSSEFIPEDVKGFLSQEIIYMDYFMEEPNTIQHQHFKEQNPAELNVDQNAGDLEEVPTLQSEEETPEEKKVNPFREGLNITICKRRVTGFGAWCTLGAAAAATICIMLLGGQQQASKQRRHQHSNSTSGFRTHYEDEGLTHLVERASRLRPAMATARGGPVMVRPANVSFGGYYDGF
ncbi:hypothetical protein HPP92_012516 [Vanilla planifolia]|uniref:DUF6821 domain-containing protein n=1 Tax=Vanilla planifolia TaxID=51239 RepID=A0A835V1T6_VANPL|nr:hypothetical protein HPP92_012516 [Vanilla planifolia]